VYSTELPAVKPSQDTSCSAALGVIKRSIGLMAVQIKRATAGEIEYRKWIEVVVVSAAHDRAFAAFGHNKGQRRRANPSAMEWNCILCCHLQKHFAEPIVGNGGHKVGNNRKLGAAERRR
jgi:hypothetical protein